MKKSITILDFSKGEVHIFPYNDAWGEDFDSIANCIYDEYDIHFKEGNCQWMISSNLSLQIH